MKSTWEWVIRNLISAEMPARNYSLGGVECISSDQCVYLVLLHLYWYSASTPGEVNSIEPI